MSAEIQANEVQQEQKEKNKEFNFRQIEKKLQEERAERERLAQELEEIKRAALQKPIVDEEDDSDLVDHRKLNKKLSKFGELQEKTTENKIQNAVQKALQEERKRNWVENNPDFYETLQNHAEKLYEKAPKLAESILKMPDGFERQQLVYNNIKALGLDKPTAKEPSIQEKIDANRKSPYYQPTGVGTAPYAAAGDFSPSGQKNAYDQMQKLKASLRI